MISHPGAAPVSDTTFKVKCGKIKIGILPMNKTDYEIVPIRNLVQHEVECVVKVKNYDFKKGAVRYQGWSLILMEMLMN